jgi:DNA-binding response OmpR family regulator/HPt (histidine-containing phosphotransfer) domain-containing protein
MRILVVEDDPTISALIETILETHKYAVDLAIDGQIGLDLSASYEYDAILMDITLPQKDGVSVCQEIRARGNKVPILLLTALDSAADRTRGLDAGADDYLGKPFDPDELLARIRALLRRGNVQSAPILTWGSLQLDPVSATVTFADRVVSVTPKEYALLELFLRNNKRVFSCSAILDHLWSYDGTPGEEAIRTHIKGLRQKLKKVGAATDFIETVYGIGYRLKPVVPPGAALLKDAWEKFNGQVYEQVAVLEQLAMRFLSQDLQADWQAIGKNIAHSLAGSLGTFGFSLSSELARQIEKLLSGHQDLTPEEGQWLFSLVTALREELEQPIPINDRSYEPDTVVDILLVSADQDLNQSIELLASERECSVKIVSTIIMARSQLQRYRTRSIVLATAIVAETEEVLLLLIDVNKQVPPIPVIALASSDDLKQAANLLGTYVSIDSTNTAEIMDVVAQSITNAEASQTHILVVDDDLKILAILQALLIPWGLKVTTLSDPQKFWDVLPIAQPDLLILDVEMPVINGLDLCISVRERANWSHLPIIFLTARVEPSLIQEVFSIGADDFVTKPVVGPEIIARITNLMERQQVQKLKVAERQRVEVQQSKLTAQDEIKIALIEIGHSLHSLQEQAVIQNEESLQLLQQTRDRFDRLHQLLLKAN